MPKHRPVVCIARWSIHPEAHRERVVYNKMPLYGPWGGWRMAGKDLISSEGDRTTTETDPADSSTADTGDRDLPARESFTDIA